MRVDEVLGIGGEGSSGSMTVAPAVRRPGGRERTCTATARPIPAAIPSPPAGRLFSINSGTSNIVYFNQAGGGSDFGDWGDGVSPADGDPSSPPYVQDAFFTARHGYQPGHAGVTAFNVVGYELAAGAGAEGYGAADRGITGGAGRVAGAGALDLSSALRRSGSREGGLEFGTARRRSQILCTRIFGHGDIRLCDAADFFKAGLPHCQEGLVEQLRADAAVAVLIEDAGPAMRWPRSRGPGSSGLAPMMRAPWVTTRQGATL